MAKLTSVATDFIRRVFSREKQNSELAVSTKDLARAQMGMGLGLGNVDTMGVGGIGDVLGLDKRLLHRYADYEEMDEYPDICSSLDIYSDDSSQMDSENKHVLWVECQDQDVRDDLTDVFHKRLKIDQNAWEMIRTLCKYGNDFEEIVIGDSGVQDLNYLPPATCRRVESKRGDFLGVVQSFSSNMEVNEKQFEQMKTKTGSAVSPQGDSAVFEDWRVLHMRLRSKNRESMYGWSIAEPARWIWRRLMLLEDAVLVYKLTRSPSRYAFYIDVGNLPREEAERAIQNVKNRIKKKKFVNPKTGKLDMRFNPLSFDEDFFLGMRDGQEKTRVDVLNGPSYQQVEDVQYFLYKLYAALKVPRAYLGYDENAPSKATLSQEDVRFAKTVLRVQNEYINGMRKVARVHLAARKIDPAAVDFKLNMTVPSAIFELGQMEVRRARADLASMMERHVSSYFLLSNVYGLSDDEIAEITKQKKEEQKLAGPTGGFESVDVPVARGISERELFDGDRADEKAALEAIRREMEKRDSKLGTQLRETQMLIREIARATSGVAW